MMIKQLTGAVGGGANPFTPSSGGAMLAQTGYKATFLGQDVVFADEAQYLKAKYALEKKTGGIATSDDDGGMLGGNFLGTMGQGLNTVAAFLNGRNLQGKIDDIDDSLAVMATTRAQIAALPTSATVGDLVPLLLKYLDAERDATELSQEALETQVLAEDIRVGGGVAQLVQNFTKGSGGTLGGSNFATVAAVGVGGLGLASLFSRNTDRRSTRR